MSFSISDFIPSAYLFQGEPLECNSFYLYFFSAEIIRNVLLQYLSVFEIEVSLELGLCGLHKNE
jgi:hypothetical protein